jgi:lysophospholipase L1-like esterase
MRKYGRYIILIVSSIHAFVLYYYGISTFVTTCLFYYCIYALLGFLAGHIKNNNLQELLIWNIRNMIIVFVLVEFAMTFIPPFTFLNNFMENDKGIYFSEYKRKIQCTLLQEIGFNKARFVFDEGNLPNSQRVVNRREFTYKCNYNQLGLRGKLPPLHKSEKEIRVVLLGDSFIEGDGTPDDSTVSVLLEQKLNADKDSCKFTVINGGISGSNPIYEQKFLYRRLLQFNPDIVISAVYSNDLWDIQVMMHQGRIPMEEYPFAVSHIFRLFYFGIMKYNDFSCLHPPKTTRKRREVLLDYLQNDLMLSKKQLNNLGIEMLTMYIPAKDEVIHKNEFLTQKQHISGFMKYDIHLLELFDVNAIRQKNEFTGRYYWKKDAHFRPEGYNLVAAILSAQIKEIDWKKKVKTVSGFDTKNN